MSVPPSASNLEIFRKETPRFIIAKKKRIYNTQYLAAINTTLWHLEKVADAYKNTKNFLEMHLIYQQLYRDLLTLRQINPINMPGYKTQIEHLQNGVAEFIKKTTALIEK